MKNRIKELRDARNWSLADLASRVGDSTTASTINKLESGRMQLTVDWIEALGRAFGIDPIGIIDDRNWEGLSEAQPIYRTDVKIDSRSQGASRRATYIVTTLALDELGLLPGDSVEVDESVTDIADLATGDIVVANIDVAGQRTTVMREFVEPAMLITNSRSENEKAMNIRSDHVELIGVVREARRQFGRKS